MANRHSVQKHAKGGGVKPVHGGKKKAYDAKGSNVEKEAAKKKRGGEVECKATGGGVAPRLDKRARGGGIKGGSGKDMTKSPFSAAALGGSEGPASNPGVQKGK
jgi:hypothetical protein